jgi:hypothetical protein
VSEENPNWTVAERSAWVDSQVMGFGRAIQAFGVDRFKKNCTKMANGFNYVLTAMFPQTGLIQMQTADSGLTTLSKDKIKDAAKKASELAKKKAGSLYASSQPSSA